MACLLATAGTTAGAFPGFKVLHLPADNRHRALEVAVWYPAEPSVASTTNLEWVADSPMFVGQTAVHNAPVKSGRFGLAVMSHGSFGHWGNQSWLAPALVRAGYIVAAPNHPGTTFRDRLSGEGTALSQRPRDIARVLDAFLAEAPDVSALTGQTIDATSVVVIGHSLGAWTALATAGARFDPALFEADCQRHPQLGACEVWQMLKAHTSASRAALAEPMGDHRVRGVVLLDAGGTRGFTPTSLSMLQIPVLLLAATEPNAQVPLELESRWLRSRLPEASTQWDWLNGATHFSFLQACKPWALALRETDAPGDGMICTDGPGVDRTTIHQRVINRVLEALEGWSPKPRLDPAATAPGPSERRSASAP